MIEEISLHVIVPVIIGFVLGLLEAYFVYSDENQTSGKDFLGDMWHGLIFSMSGVFVAANIPWVLSLDFFPEFLKGFMMINENGISLTASIIITLVMLTKMVASHAIKGLSSNGFQEKFSHKLIIALLVGFSAYGIAPLYALDFFLGIAEVLPWLPL